MKNSTKSLITALAVMALGISLGNNVLTKANKENINYKNYSLFTGNYKTRPTVLHAGDPSEADIEAANAVIALIDALPPQVFIELKDKPAVEAARAAYNALTNEQKALVPKEKNQLLMNLEAKIRSLQADVDREQKDREAAASVATLIEALPNIADVNLDDKTVVQAARAAFYALTYQGQTFVPREQVEKLIALEEKIAELQAIVDKEVADKKAANDFSALVDALPSITVLTLDNKIAVEEVFAAYNDLTDDQKGYVDSTKVTTLNALVAKINELQQAADKVAAQAVCDLIDALPSITFLTLDDKAAVEEVFTAYNNLTDDQKSYVDNSKVNTLHNLLNKIIALQKEAEKLAFDTLMANSVGDLIDALPSESTIDLTNKASVDIARAAYNDLTDDQKALVPVEILNRLIALETKLTLLQNNIDAANSVIALIDALPDITTLTIDNKDAVVEARSAYNDLSNDQKSLVPEAKLNSLSTLEAKLVDLQIAADIVAANAVIALIDALPSESNINLTNKDAVDAARAAYNDLTDDQKALVPVEKLNVLIALETKLVPLQAALDAANAVIVLIDALPSESSLTLANKAAVEAARAAYNDLDEDSKVLVPEAKLNSLSTLEAKLVDLHTAAQEAANSVIALIDALPSESSLTLDNKGAVEAARSAYNDLTNDEKAFVPVEKLNSLSALEAKLADLTKEAEEDKKGCGGSVVAASSIVCALALAGFCLISRKRKEY